MRISNRGEGMKIQNALSDNVLNFLDREEAATLSNRMETLKIFAHKFAPRMLA